MNSRKTKVTRVPRKLKKALKKGIITLDIGSLPDNFDFDKWISFYYRSGIALYDSSKGEAPKLLSRKSKYIKVINVND